MMNYSSNKIQYSGWFPILTALLMLLFWTLFAIFLPMQEEYVNWVLDSDWTWINIIGFIGSLLGVFALNSIFSVIESKNKLAFIGYLSGVMGVVILTAILFFEAFILRAIAKDNPEIIDLNAGFYQNIIFKIVSLAGGILLTIGGLIMGLSLMLKKTFKKWKVVLFMIACPMFGIVIMPGNIRLLGVLLYSISLIAIGIELNKTTYANKS